jgi:predicted aspartyl protease
MVGLAAFGTMAALAQESMTAPDAPSDPAACHLVRLAELDLETETDGEVTIPVTVNGTAGRWLIDTGNVRSMIADATANVLSLKVKPSTTPMEMFGGTPIFFEADVDSMDIGGMTGHDYSLMVVPSRFMPTDSTGILAPDIMARYDVDFDFAGGKFKFFDQDHCPQRVVYWTRESYARVPFDLSSNEHIVVQVQIDGKEMDAVIDTGTPKSSMSMQAARSVFHLDEKSPNMEAVGQASINGLPPTATYHYPFQNLTFEGVAVSNPSIIIVDDRGLPGHTPRLILGIQTLRQLHMYVAYGEKALYVTGAEAR